jgi:hypothetical protein
VATVAVASKLDPLCPYQDIDAGAIERRAEGIGMQRLAPLMICLLVAMAAVSGIWKSARFKKFVPFTAALPGNEILSFPKGKL